MGIEGHDATEIKIEAMQFYASLKVVADKTGLGLQDLLRRQVGFKAHPSACLACNHEWNAFDLIIETVRRGPHDWMFMKASLVGDTKSFFVRKTRLKCSTCDLESDNVDVLYDYTGHTTWNSDRRLKRELEQVAVRPDGITLYRFKYLNTDEEYVGVIAQEVQLLRPDAVESGDEGFLRVHYDRLGSKMMAWSEWSGTARA